MLQVETEAPVFSNAIGDKLRNRLTPAQKEARRKRLGSKAKNVYSKAKESGILQGLENLALGSGTSQQGGTTNTPPIPEPAPESWWSKKTKTQKGIIITSSLLVVGLSVWYFGFRKPVKK